MFAIFLGLFMLIICVILGISVGNFFRFVYTHNLCNFRDKCLQFFLGLFILIICVILGISVCNFLGLFILIICNFRDKCLQFFRFVYTHNLCNFRDKCLQFF